MLPAGKPVASWVHYTTNRHVHWFVICNFS